MNTFSPETIYEQARIKLAANQPQFRERFQQMIPGGMALCITINSEYYWFVCSPQSRLEGQVFFAYDLAKEGEAALIRLEFEDISFMDDTWGSLSVGEFPVVEFRPLAHSEDKDLVALWNTRSGRPPVQLEDF